MKSVTINEEQAKLVMQCLDHAVKAGGLNAAPAILPIAKDIEAQLTLRPVGDQPEGSSPLNP